MNSIQELILILHKYGGSATIEEISSEYAKTHHMILMHQHIVTIENTLMNNPSCVVYNGINKKWRILHDMNGVQQIKHDIKPKPSSDNIMIVCRTTYMKYYDGITLNDSPVNGGSYVAEHGDAYEKYNFHKYEDGYCYGFVETKYPKGKKQITENSNKVVLENISSNASGKEYIENIRVVFAAKSPIKGETVVVGWYDNATVYRKRIKKGELDYCIKCLHEDAHLISEEDRDFVVPQAARNPFGIGQSNFWYIQRFDVAKQYQIDLMNYIDGCINTQKKSWLLICNENKYDVHEAFRRFKRIDWRQVPQLNEVRPGDNAYVYVSAPKMKILYKATVTKTCLNKREIDDSELCTDLSAYERYMEIEFIEAYDENTAISRDMLIQHGLNPNNPMAGPMQISENLDTFLNSL